MNDSDRLRRSRMGTYFYINHSHADGNSKYPTLRSHPTPSSASNAAFALTFPLISPKSQLLHTAHSNEQRVVRVEVLQQLRDLLEREVIQLLHQQYLLSLVFEWVARARRAHRRRRVARPVLRYERDELGVAPLALPTPSAAT